ncbi:MAG: rhodanese-like domain-containing protein [Candidatus Caldarchaeum sp.]
MKVSPVFLVAVVVVLVVGFVLGAVASPALFPVQIPTVTQTVQRTVERTVTATATVTVEKPAAVDKYQILYEELDRFVNNIPVGKWYLIDVKDFKEALDRGEKIFILDVREKAEWDAGRIQGAVHVRLTELTDNLAKLPANKKEMIVVYCKVGLRGMIATAVLRILGYENVYNLKGGLDAWTAAGYPVVK